jgi:hypothetical protein
MILRPGYEIFLKTRRVPLTDLYLNYVYSINLEEATT